MYILPTPKEKAEEHQWKEGQQQQQHHQHRNTFEPKEKRSAPAVITSFHSSNQKGKQPANDAEWMCVCEWKRVLCV